MRVRATPHRLNEIKPLDGSIRGGISDGNTRPGPETTRLERRGGSIIGGWRRRESRAYRQKKEWQTRWKRKGWGWTTREKRKSNHTRWSQKHHGQI